MSACKNCLKILVCKYNDGHNFYCKEDYQCPHFLDKTVIEKQIPKKPTPQVVKGGKRLIGNGWWCNGTTVYKCPCCNSWITLTYKHCIECGQALDWSDTE